MEFALKPPLSGLITPTDTTTRQEFFFGYPLYRACGCDRHTGPFWRRALGTGAPRHPPGQPRGLTDPGLRRSLRHAIERHRTGAQGSADDWVLRRVHDHEHLQLRITRAAGARPVWPCRPLHGRDDCRMSRCGFGGNGGWLNDWYNQNADMQS